MKHLPLASGFVAVALAMSGVTSVAAAAPPAASGPPARHDAAYFESQAAAFQRKADFYATREKEYAAGTKPAVTAQARHFADLRDQYLCLAVQNRALAARAGRPDTR